MKQENNHNLLIVYQSRELREFMRNTLEREGYTIYEATNGLDAVVKMKSLDGKIDVILLGVIMPMMNGFEFLERLKSNVSCAVGVILVTSLPSETSFIRVGISEKIIKCDLIMVPFSVAELLKSVEEAIEQVKIRRKNLKFIAMHENSMN